MGATIIPPNTADVKIKWANICKARCTVLGSSWCSWKWWTGWDCGSAGLREVLSTGASCLEWRLQDCALLLADMLQVYRWPPGGSAWSQRESWRRQSLHRGSLVAGLPLHLFLLFFPSFKWCWNFTASTWWGTGSLGLHPRLLHPEGKRFGAHDK